jgi:hypothetical protein
VTRYIHIARWNEFQHYKDRDPKWIKVYTRINRDDNFLSLTGHRRAILLGLWLERAVSHSSLRLDTRMLTRRLQLRVTVSDIEALNHAGFITISASETVRKRKRNASPEEETEREKRKTLAPAAREPVDKSTSKNGRDELWDELERLFGKVAPKTNSHAKRNKACADLRRLGASPMALRHAYNRWPRLYPGANPTDIAIATHYPQLVEQARRMPSLKPPCPECGMGGGRHIADCSKVAA